MRQLPNGKRRRIKKNELYRGQKMSESVSSVKVESKSPWSPFEAASRRGHGSIEWANNYSLRQPQDQDGTSAARDVISKITNIGSRLQHAAFGGATLVEPEDARLTGGTRSLMRRLMGLNITSRIVSPITAKKIGRPAKKSERVAVRAQVA